MIPKIVHLCWLSGDPYPELIARCLSSWQRHLPDYQVKLWSRSTFDVEATPWVAEAAAVGKYAFAADYIRLHALYHHGGIYLDADVEVLRSFDDLLQLSSFIGRETGGDLEPAVIGAAPGTAWVGACLAHYENRHFLLPDGTRDQRPLPLIVADVLRRLQALPDQPLTGSVDVESVGLRLFDASYFSPKNVHSGELRVSPHTYAVHHFDGQWVDRTWQHGLKQMLHRTLLSALGPRAHRWIVSTIRGIK
jgi:hypothetical protein